MKKLKHGTAYWIDGFPPLRGGDGKRRPAIYLDLADMTSATEHALFVFVGSSTEVPDPQRDYDAIRVSYGLPEACWVYPEWVVEVPRSAVGDEAGRLPLVLMEPLVDSVLERMWSGGWGMSEPPEPTRPG